MTAKVTRIAENSLSSKLIEMGLYPGKEVKVVFKAPFGDPIAVELDGYTLSLRKKEAQLIEIA
jgi:Fe2+ transport system protein FeoA